MTKGLYKFHLDGDRMGDLTSVFIADDAQVTWAIGEKVYISDAFGRHGHANFVLTDEMITLKSTDENVLSIVEELGLETGDNPLLHIYRNCSKCETWVYSGEDEWLVSDEEKEIWQRTGMCAKCSSSTDKTTNKRTL